MVIEPTGTKGGIGGGYTFPLMLETANCAMLPLDASMPLVEIALVDIEPNNALDVTTIELMFAVKELTFDVMTEP
jgi:hypothetical protein